MNLGLRAPLLTPTPINMQPGHPAIEPSITISNVYGRYDSNWKCNNEKDIWSIIPLIDFQFGITERTGIEVIASFVTNIQGSKTFTHLEDTLVLFGYQVSNDQKDSWVPDFRLFLQTLFPSGKHDKLDLVNNGIDVTGQGAYFVGPNLSFQKLFYLKNNFFILHWSLGYLFPTRAKIHGVNAYGGGIGTHGNIRPGHSIQAFLAGEYSFNPHWVFAMDMVFLHQTKTSRFKGELGVTSTGKPASVGLPSSTQLSITPSLQYNLNSHSGFLFGSWTTIAGRNSEAFASCFLAFLHVF